MSLKDELDLLRVDTLRLLPPEISAKLAAENEKLLSGFLEKKAINKGASVPDVFFRDNNLENVYLSELLKDHNLVLSFFRGTWCPYCSLELIHLAGISDEVRKRGARLVAVSPELHRFSRETIIKNNINFPVYTDLGNIAAAKFGLVFDLPPGYREIYKAVNIHLNTLNGENSWSLPMPATFIISKEGIIASRYVNADYTRRMDTEDILEQLDLLKA